MRPWTRLSVAHMLEASSDRITGSTNDEAIDIYAAIEKELQPDMRIPLDQKFGRAQLESVYQRVMGIAGTPLRDSFHLGQTDINDFGRPYAGGFNSYSGFSTRAHYGMFSLYFRGEFQHAPSWEGYPLSVAQTLAKIDDFATFSSVPFPGNTTIPLGPVASVNNLTRPRRLRFRPHRRSRSIFRENGQLVWTRRRRRHGVEQQRRERLQLSHQSRRAALHSVHFSHYGSHSLRFLRRPFKGHNDPVSPWVHAEKISFKPTPNFEFGFQRTVIWGGKGHEPVTLGTFWRSFYSISDTNGAEKFSRRDPGARFSAVDFSWRLPYLRKWLTLY